MGSGFGNSGAPWRPCFLTNPNNLGRGSLKEHFYKIIWKSVQWTRRLVFYIDNWENKLCPLEQWIFQSKPDKKNGLTILVEDHQRNISAKLYGNGSSGFGQEDFYIFQYMGKISLTPWQPCFLTNLNGLNNLGRGSTIEHFCKIILKSVQWFRTRRFLKFFI